MSEHRRADRRNDVWGAGRIAIIYAIAAGLWIFASDQLIEFLFPDAAAARLTAYQTFKGLLFVAATSVFLWALVLRRLRLVRRVEGERSASEYRLATFADNLPGVAYIKDVDGRFVFIRGRLPEGAPPADDLSGSTADRILLPAASARTVANDRAVMETGDGSQLIETVEIAGRTVHYLIHRFPLRGPRGERWLGGVALDVTERQDAEARIRDLARELEAANRSKDQFLSNLSHELRTPITAIRLWVDVLRAAGPGDPESVREAAEMIRNSAMFQSQLIEDLLDVTRIAAGKLKVELAPMGLADVVRDTAAMLEPSAGERDVTIACSIPADDDRVAIRGDVRRVRQVVWNLLTNAIKFSHPHGRVRVTLTRDAGDWVLAVADDGIGIAATLLPHLFERFRQADTSRTRAEGGLGIGLSLVRHMVEAHGGTVTAESDGEGKGSRFTVRVPALTAASGGASGVAQAPASPDASATAAAAEPAPLSGRRVLLVEDNSDSRTGMYLLLGRVGAKVTSVDDVAAALSAGDEFDVLLSDIGLPDRDGCELIADLRLRPAWRDKPALAISAYALPEDRQRAIAAGFDGFVVKPVDPDALVETVVGWIERKRKG